MASIRHLGSAPKDSPIYTGGIIVSTVPSYRPTAEVPQEPNAPEGGGEAPVQSGRDSVPADPTDGTASEGSVVAKHRKDGLRERIAKELEENGSDSPYYKELRQELFALLKRQEYPRVGKPDISTMR